MYKTYPLFKAWIYIYMFTISFLLIPIQGLSSSENMLYVTEICTKNRTCAYDDNGEYGADYVEITNFSDEDLSLDRYGLSDKKKKLYRFCFEQTVIPAHASIIVWNSAGEHEYDEYIREDYLPMDIHDLGFGIKQDETLYFTDSYGRNIQTIHIPEVPDGFVLSSCRYSPTDFRICRPSPYLCKENYEESGESNSNHNPTLEAPAFSINGGWYEDPIELTLSSDQGKIYYTLDGTTPDKNALEYHSSIRLENISHHPNLYSSIQGVSITNSYIPDYPVDKATVVKAIAITDSGEKSDIVSQTYFVGLDKKKYLDVSKIEITVNPHDFFDPDNGIYVLGKVWEKFKQKYRVQDIQGNAYLMKYTNYAKEGRGWERTADVTYYSINNEVLMHQKVGIRIHGGFSVSFNQKSFTLYSREEYSNNKHFTYDFFGQKNNKIMLRTGGVQDAYVTKLRDAFNQSLAEPLFLGYQKSEPCVVFLNGEYWGLYNLQETIGEEYIKSHYGINDVIIMKNEFLNTDVDITPSYEEIVNYAMTEDLSDQTCYNWICCVIDIDSYIDYYCHTIYTANYDSIDNNFARWRSIRISDQPYEDGKWRWLLYDTDASVGMLTRLCSYDIDSFVCAHDINHDPLGDRGDVLFSSLFMNDSFRERFQQRFITVSSTCFDYNVVSPKLHELACKYEVQNVLSQLRFRGNHRIPEYKDDTFDGIYTREVFWNDISVIDDFFRNRSDYILSYLEDHVREYSMFVE